MEGVTIRQGGPADAEAIHRLVVGLAAYEHEPDAVEATPAALRAQLARARPPFECLLAEVDGRAVGFAIFFPSYSTWRGREGVWLEDLFVEEPCRRRGIGSALLRHVARIACARGYARLEWAVLDWNVPAIRFYEKLGAVPLGEWTTYRLSDGALAAAGER
ncbi:MAG TPA: GNAT family N-acetyltransferase [Candidatus Binatia bacterium]|nr:GNAT family N-acetyltransferase [Candidatus Binatia bacterium]